MPGGVEKGNAPVRKKNTPFLREEFASMVENRQWVVLPYSVAKGLPGLRLSPPGVKVERDQIPCWLGDYSYLKLTPRLCQ